jgi:ketosteroid isomerase-like protein
MPDLKQQSHSSQVASKRRHDLIAASRLRPVGARSASVLFAISVACGIASLQLGAQSNPNTLPSVPGYDALLRPQAPASPLAQPALSPGVLMLMELEGKFAQSVAAGGGKAFATWFADDAVTLNNGRPAVLGRASIGAEANWDPKVYQLTWTPQGAQMGPSGDMGFTWGHYEGRSTDKNGQPVVTSGRYFTVWKKTADGSWKVALDASANEPPAAAECCTLPKP